MDAAKSIKVAVGSVQQFQDANSKIGDNDAQTTPVVAFGNSAAYLHKFDRLMRVRLQAGQTMLLCVFRFVFVAKHSAL